MFSLLYKIALSKPTFSRLALAASLLGLGCTLALPWYHPLPVIIVSVFSPVVAVILLMNGDQFFMDHSMVRWFREKKSIRSLFQWSLFLIIPASITLARAKASQGVHDDFENLMGVLLLTIFILGSFTIATLCLFENIEIRKQGDSQK